MGNPIFETDRLIIRPRTIDDLEACLAMDRDAEVTKYIPGPWDDKSAHRAFVIDRINKNYPDGLGYWSVFAKHNPKKFLGWILLIPDDGGSDNVEIGWRFTRSAWGNGYASEAAAVIIQHGFKAVGLPHIIADIDSQNAASIGLANKLGLKHRKNIISPLAPYLRFQISC